MVTSSDGLREDRTSSNRRGARASASRQTNETAQT